MRLHHLVIAALAMCGWVRLAAASAQSPTRWELIRGDLSSQPVQWTGVTDQGVQVNYAGSLRTIPWDDFVEIRRINAPAPSTRPADFTLICVNGDRLRGTPAGIDGEHLNWSATVAGHFAIPLTRVTAIQRIGAPDIGQSTPPTQDQAWLVNGDQVAGIITNLTNQTLTMQLGAGSAEIPLATLLRLRLAGTGEPPATTGRLLRVRLIDGSRWTASEVRADGSRVNITMAEGAHQVLESSTVIAMEQLDGPVRRLASLPPAESVQVSRFGLSWPARMNQSVTGGPIRFGTTLYPHGIGVHAYSRLAFDLPDGYRIFRTQYAIEGDGRYADVVVRIRVDGKVVYEKPDVRAGQLSPVIELPVSNARSLILEVDPGNNGDVQDYFNWIDPVLMRQAPSTQPAR